MKNKKFKLFASLTSLVMVVAVMAVGVWAATGATATIKATASFSAVDGIQGSIVAVSGTNSVKLDGATINNTPILSVDLGDQSNVTEQKTLSFALVDGGTTPDGYIVADSDDTTSFAVTYKITNAGPVSFNFTVTITAPTEQSAGVQMTAAVTAIDGQPQNAATGIEVAAAAAAGQTVAKTVTITYSLTGTHTGGAIELSSDNNTMALVEISLAK